MSSESVQTLSCIDIFYFFECRVLESIGIKSDELSFVVRPNDVDSMSSLVEEWSYKMTKEILSIPKVLCEKNNSQELSIKDFFDNISLVSQSVYLGRKRYEIEKLKNRLSMLNFSKEDVENQILEKRIATLETQVFNAKLLHQSTFISEYYAYLIGERCITIKQKDFSENLMIELLSKLIYEFFYEIIQFKRQEPKKIFWTNFEVDKNLLRKQLELLKTCPQNRIAKQENDFEKVSEENKASELGAIKCHNAFDEMETLYSEKVVSTLDSAVEIINFEEIVHLSEMDRAAMQPQCLPFDLVDGRHYDVLASIIDKNESQISFKILAATLTVLGLLVGAFCGYAVNYKSQNEVAKSKRETENVLRLYANENQILKEQVFAFSQQAEGMESASKTIKDLKSSESLETLNPEPDSLNLLNKSRPISTKLAPRNDGSKKEGKKVTKTVRDEKKVYSDFVKYIKEKIDSGEEIKSLISSLPTHNPVKNGVLTSKFGTRADPFSGEAKTHYGLDIAGLVGSDIYAPSDGVVILSGFEKSFGHHIAIYHGHGVVSFYAHNQRNLIKVGKRVKEGDVIAKLGDSGRADGPHLHYELMVNGERINPSRLFSGEFQKNFTSLSH